MKINPKYIQLLSEALIPLLGFFLWDWSLYFILLFYFIDMIGAELVMHLKSKRICNYNSNEQKTSWFGYGVLSVVALTFTILCIHFSMMFIVEGIAFKNEIIDFWNYEELGIKQGYVLVPLVLFVSFQQYKMEFVMPARYRIQSLKLIWSAHIQALLVVLGFSGLCLGVSLFILIPEVVVVLGIIVFTVLYKLRTNHSV